MADNTKNENQPQGGPAPEGTPQGDFKKHFEDFNKRLAAQDKLIATQAKEINTLKSMSLQTEVGAKPAKQLTIPTKAVEFDGKKYQWNVAQLHVVGHGIVSAEAAATDPAIMKQILAIEGQGVLRELV